MKTIEELRRFLSDALPDTRIYLFGSRARGDATPYSDIDIAIESNRPLRARLASIRYAIEASAIPYKVDLIDLAQAPYLKTIVEKEGIRWH